MFFALALAAVLASSIFGLNGSQYDSWVRALQIMAALLALAALAVWIGVLDVTRKRARIVVAVSAGATVIALAILTTKLYTDGSPHYPHWPHTLAWISVTAFAVGLVAALDRG